MESSKNEYEKVSQPTGDFYYEDEEFAEVNLALENEIEYLKILLERIISKIKTETNDDVLMKIMEKFENRVLYSLSEIDKNIVEMKTILQVIIDENQTKSDTCE